MTIILIVLIPTFIIVLVCLIIVCCCKADIKRKTSKVGIDCGDTELAMPSVNTHHSIETAP